MVSGLAVAGAAAPASAEPRAEFHVAAQPLESGLLAFAEQAHVSVAFPPEGLAGARTAGLDGRFTTPEGLRRMLAGTGYTALPAGDRAFRIVAAPRRDSAARPASSGEVVVIARRPTHVGDLPRSVSDVRAAAIDTLPAPDTHRLSGAITGLLFTDVGDGRDKPYLRGVSDGALTGRAQSTVGIYLDGVRLTYAAPDPQLELVDVARVDVLRGPQGALYGAGSIGGILSIESNAPDPSGFGASALAGLESTSGGGIGYNLEGVVNAPVVADRLAVRVAAYDHEKAGWLDSATTGARDANSTRRQGLRGGIRLDASPDLSVSLFAAKQTIDSKDSQYLQASGAQRTAHLPEPHDNDFLVAGGTVHGERPFGTVTSTTAYVRHEIDSRYDAFGRFAAFGVDPTLPRPLDERSELGIVVHETRITAPADARLQWFAGVFHSDGDNTSERTLRDGAPGVWPATAYVEHRTDGVDETAVFGEITWPLPANLSLSTGLRLFRYDVKTDSVQQDLVHGTDHFRGRLDDHGAAPDIRLSYRPANGALFYIGASEGYRSGGFNTGPAIGATPAAQPFRRYAGDELWTYEIGARGALFDNSLHISAAAFENVWRRVQTDSLVVAGLAYTGNAGQANALGLEADIDWRPADNLTLSGRLLVNEPDLNRPDPSFPAGAVADLPGAPEATASGAIAYDTPLAVLGADASAHIQLDASFVGQSASVFSGTLHRDAYAQVNALASVTSGQVDVSVYADNLLDAAGATFSDANPYADGGPFRTELRPRTFGILVRRRY